MDFNKCTSEEVASGELGAPAIARRLFFLTAAPFPAGFRSTLRMMTGAGAAPCASRGTTAVASSSAVSVGAGGGRSLLAFLRVDRPTLVSYTTAQRHDSNSNTKVGGGLGRGARFSPCVVAVGAQRRGGRSHDGVDLLHLQRNGSDGGQVCLDLLAAVRVPCGSLTAGRVGRRPAVPRSACCRARA